MRFGFFTMPNHHPASNWTLSYDRLIGEIVQAERLGFDEFWVGEHHSGGRENVPTPELILAKASALTHRIRLGTGVVSLPYQDPFLVATRMAFLDHLTHGRLLYGFGGGGLPTDRAMFEVDAAEATPRTFEAMEIIWRLLTEEGAVSHHGNFYTYNERRLQVGPHQLDPPFAIAGLTGTSNFAKAGENGWSALSVFISPVNTDRNPGVPDLRAHGEAMCAAATAAGLDPMEARNNWRVSREVYVADSKEQAIAEIRDGVRRFYQEYLLPNGVGALMKNDVNMSDADVTFEYMVENVPFIIGSPDDCVQQIKDLHDQVGGFGTLLINSQDWVTSDRWTRSCELFARYVAPHFQANQRIEHRLKLQSDMHAIGQAVAAQLAERRAAEPREISLS